MQAYFGRAQFAGAADFSDIQFSENAIFLRSQFSGMANFWGVQFSRVAYFGGAQLSGKAIFDVAKFSGVANFYGAKFSGESSFNGSQFFQEAHFENAEFFGMAAFKIAKFSWNGNFHGAQFKGRADFNGTEFYAGIDKLDGAIDGTVTPVTQIPLKVSVEKFWVGMKIIVGKNDNSGNGFEISAINHATKTLTISSGVKDAQNDDAVVRGWVPITSTGSGDLFA